MVSKRAGRTVGRMAGGLVGESIGFELFLPFFSGFRNVLELM